LALKADQTEVDTVTAAVGAKGGSNRGRYCDRSGFENVEQVGGFVSYMPVSSGGRSGDPANGGSFTHTFTTAGTYYFRSQIHQTLRVKVTVMDCVSCVAVVGYDGAAPATLALALSSRAAGDFALAAGAAGLARVMTFLTVYSGQTLTLTGAQTPASQLATAGAKVDVQDGGSLVMNAAYVSGVCQRRSVAGAARDPGGHHRSGGRDGVRHGDSEGRGDSRYRRCDGGLRDHSRGPQRRRAPR